MVFKIGMGQFYPALGDVEKNFALLKKSIEKAQKRNVDLLVFPELCLTGYFLKDMVPNSAVRADSPIIKELLKMSKEISLCLGLVEESKEHMFYNSSFYLENGKITHVHRKVYLPTYGMFDEQRYFSKGNKIRAFDTKLGRFAILICEDMWHPSSPYIAAQDGAEMIIVPASSPSRGIGKKEKLEISRTWESINLTYARMLSQFICFVNRVGYEDGVNFWGGSEIISPSGEKIARGKYFREEMITAEINTEEIRRNRIPPMIHKDEDRELTIKELSRIQKKAAKG